MFVFLIATTAIFAQFIPIPKRIATKSLKYLKLFHNDFEEASKSRCVYLHELITDRFDLLDDLRREDPHARRVTAPSCARQDRPNRLRRLRARQQGLVIRWAFVDLGSVSLFRDIIMAQPASSKSKSWERSPPMFSEVANAFAET